MSSTTSILGKRFWEEEGSGTFYEYHTKHVVYRKIRVELTIDDMNHIDGVIQNSRDYRGRDGMGNTEIAEVDQYVNDCFEGKCLDDCGRPPIGRVVFKQTIDDGEEIDDEYSIDRVE